MVKIAVDFGTSNTVVSYWNETIKSPEIVKFERISRSHKIKLNNEYKTIYLIPSIIFFGRGYLLGESVFEKNLENHFHTFKWIKRYIIYNQSLFRKINSTNISYFDAGFTFLKAILNKSKIKFKNIDEVIFTVPVESFETYSDWLSKLCVDCGIKKFSFIDEPTACALGYEVNLEEDDIIGIFDFGGGTLDISIIKIKKNPLRAFVLGKSGLDIGGIDIDKWLLLDFLEKNNIKINEVKHIYNSLISEIEKVKINLSFEDEINLTIFDNLTGKLACNYTKIDFENILKKNRLYYKIQQTLDSAIDYAADKGIRKRDIKQILMVGGTSLIPSIQNLIKQNFSDKEVKYFMPFEAVAIGAIKFISGETLFDFIQHSYALRHWDKKTNKHKFETIIPKGTKYPTDENFKSYIIDGNYKGQRELELQIYEISDDRLSQKDEVEITFDSEGIAHLVSFSERDNTHLWLNEKNPTFIKLDPPCEQGGGKRIKITFKIDQNKHLCISVYDLLTNVYLYKNQPIVKLF